MKWIKKLLTCFSVVLLAPTAFAAGKASHVLVIVWDGMRPDFVTEATTPTLWAMSQNGVTFLHHHPVYLSSTEVNGTAFATGVYPGQSGVIGNREFRPAINPLAPIDTQSLPDIRKADELTGNHYLAFPTVDEILHQHGLHTVVAGSKPVAVLQDRSPRGENSLGIDFFGGDVLPDSVNKTLTEALGKFPEPGDDKMALDEWTTKALTGPLWRDGVPSYSLLWLAEPDFSQHRHSPGSPAALAAIKSSDRNLGRVLQTLKQKNLLDSTDVIVVSDHGFSTIQHAVNIASELRTHGFRASRQFADAERTNGDIMVVGNGGSVSCYVTGHDPKVIAQVVHFFQAQPYAGVIFTKEPVGGTFSLAEAHVDSPFAPDILMALRWNAGRNKYGAPGLICADRAANGLQPGQGQHASLSVSDMHNTCVAFGPDFKKGMKDETPSGNIDIAPTVLWILGVKPDQKMSGRVLGEAMIDCPGTKAAAPRHQDAEWKGDGFVWHQYLDSSEVNGTIYYDQGNGHQSPIAESAAK